MNKKLLLLSVILISSAFGATKEDPTSKSKEQEIAELEEACTAVALPSILGLFPPQMHEHIKEDIEYALKEVNKKQIKEVIDVLAQIVTKMHEQQMRLDIIPDIIKWLIIGIDRDLSGENSEAVQKLEDEQFAEKSVHLPLKTQALSAKPTNPKSSAEQQNVRKQVGIPQAIPPASANKAKTQQPISPKTTSTSKRKIATRTQGEVQGGVQSNR